MKRIKLKFIIFLGLVVSVFSIFGVSEAKASGNVYGWAWSENIGWISFNKDPDPYGAVTGGGGSFDYGVNIETDGNLTGYAWSENIGWIKFDPAGPYPATTPDYDYSACVDLPEAGQICDGNGNSTSSHLPVSGWARACAVFLSGCSGTLNSNRGNWDGWINLDNTISESNAVWINNSVTPSPFHNWGWGGDDTLGEAVIGWLSFNCAEGGNCVSYDYKVVTDFSFDSCVDESDCPSDENCIAGICTEACVDESDCPSGEDCVDGVCELIQPPTVTQVGNSNSLSTPPLTAETFSANYCSGNIYFGWTYVDTDNNPETRFQFQIDDTSATFPSPEINRDITGLSNPDGTVNSQAIVVATNPGADKIAYNKTYYWRVKVYDNQGLDSGWKTGVSFTTPAHAYPGANFSLTPSSAPLINGIDNVGFTDLSTCYKTNDISSYACKDLASTNYGWWFEIPYSISDILQYITGHTSNSAAKGDTSHDYTSAGTYHSTLNVCDELGCCYTSQDVNVVNPLNTPQWQEISPF